jgi:hypothetical protein
MLLKRHEAKYIKFGCTVANHFSLDSHTQGEHLPPTVRYHSDGNYISFHYSASLGKNEKEKKWVIEPDSIRKNRGVVEFKWHLSNGENS